MKKKFTLAVLFLYCITTTFAQYNGPGTGTKDDPYLVMNADQLYSVRNFLGNSNVYFSIISNIDISNYGYGAGWEPIGDLTSPFKGKIEGNGYKITGLKINKRNSNYVGLFGCTYAATIRNITIEGDISGNNYVGGIVGSTQSSNNSVEYENVHFHGTIKGNNYVGGIAGSDSPNKGYTSTGPGIEYKNCGFSGIISGYDYVGGIVGGSSSTITNCIVESTINANQYVGGISGNMSGSTNNLIENCYVSIVLSASSGYVGGVSGNGIGGDIKKCAVNGNIEALGNKVGGIIGYAHCYSGVFHDFEISDSYFVGYLKANDYVGGIIGYNGGDVWQNKYTYDYYGYVRVKNNYVKASIVGHDKVGGILSGYTFSYNPIIESNVCMCSSIDSETENVGRIQARQGGATPKKCYSIYSTKLNVAGVSITEDEIISNPSLHGTDIGEYNLKTSTFYQGLSWDFGSTWGIIDTECIPYLQTQAAPPIIQSSLVSGETTVSGNSLEGGNVKIVVGGSEYTTSTKNNKWSITVPELHSGIKVVARAETDNLFPSYDVEYYVAYFGEGTQDTPYLVRTYSDLKNMHGSGYYKLDNDIDLADPLNEESPLEGWQPLGVYSNPIMYLDGDNHKITNLFISRDVDLVGLFSNLTDATIKNLTIEVAEGKNVQGKGIVGVLAGRLNNCLIDNVSIKGLVKGDDFVGGLAGQIYNGNLNNVIISESSIVGRNHVGGIAGTSSASLSLCRFEGNVCDIVEENDGIDNSTTVYVGGMIAVSNGTICESMVEGNVTATREGSKVGGIVSDNYSTISNSYCTANVNGGTYAAGITATNYSVVEYCYASGNITTTDTDSQTVSCGLIGYNNSNNAVVTNCAAMNRYITASSDVGSVYRIVGGIKNGASIPGETNHTLHNMVLSINGIRQSLNDNPFNGYKREDDTFKTQVFYVEKGWDFTSTWSISEEQSYPYLKKLREVSSGSETDTPQDDEQGVTDDTDISQLSNVLYVESMEVQKGAQTILPIDMNNVASIKAFQFDLYLPEGVTIAKDEDEEDLIELTSRAAKSHTIAFSEQPDGAIRLICTSMSGATFKGNEGAIVNVTLDIAQSMTDGDYDIEIKNIELSDGTPYNPADIKATLTVKTYTPGDVDGTGTVSVNDAVCVINYILGEPAEDFIEPAADLDGNGVITVNDVVILINDYILGGNSQNSLDLAFLEDVTADDDYLYIEEDNLSNMTAGEEREIEVFMNTSRTDIQGLQCDIYLPDGMEFVPEEDGDEKYYADKGGRAAKSHSVASQLMADGSVRVVETSTSGAKFKANELAVFYFTVRATANTAYGQGIRLCNMELSYGGAPINPEDRTFDVKVKAGTVSLNSEGYATFSHASDVEVEGAEVYTATRNGNIISCTKEEQSVAAFNGVILKGEPDATVTLYTNNGVEGYTGNELKPTTTAAGVADIETALVLSGNMFKNYTGAAFVADKAYMPYDGNSANAIEMVFNGATAIDGIASENNLLDGAVIKTVEDGKLVIKAANGKYSSVGAKMK